VEDTANLKIKICTNAYATVSSVQLGIGKYLHNFVK